MLSKVEKEKLHQLILKRIGDVKEEITDFEEMTKPVSPDNAIGRVSRMDAINNNSVTEAALRHALERLSKLEFALVLIKNDDYGKCLSCGNPIPLARLLFMPESNKCMSCAGQV